MNWIWHYVLLDTAVKASLTPKQTQIFVQRFSKENKDKKDDEFIAMSAKKSNVEPSIYELSYFKLKTGIFKRIAAEIYKELENAGPHKREKLLKWLEDKSDEIARQLSASATDKNINWHYTCLKKLVNQQQIQQLTSNYLLGDDEEANFQYQQIYVPLALVQRTKPDKRSGEFFPAAGSDLYEPQYEKKQLFEHSAFFTQILERGEGKTKGKQIALIGEPGAGKTTLLQDIAFWVMTDPARQQETQDVAIWISLADLQGRSLEDYLLQVWLNQTLEVARVTPDQEDALVELFKSGRVWLLLDGVDEMTSGDPRQAKALQSQLTGWVALARVVLTCRLNFWQANVNLLAEFETYRLLDFDYPHQVHQFIDNWFENSDSGTGKWLKIELSKAERARLRNLIQNPLRLALLCRNCQSRKGELPQTKAGLYQKFVQQFYNWKKLSFPISTEEQKKLNRALGGLAKRDIDEGACQYRLRESFISQVLGNRDDKNSLFHLALKLGWLNDVGIAAESDQEEKVYAFFHPTFEEYFAASAINDWEFFLNHILVTLDHPHANYRIFEPQWKEVILLWLGRKDVRKEKKEQFIQALVEFNDGCGDFYKARSYFLAAAGIAEFGDCSRADEIVAQIVEYAFGYFDIEEQKWVSFLRSIAEEARAILPETDRPRAILTLEELIENCEDKEIRLLSATSLLEIDPGNSIAIITLKELIENCEDKEIRLLSATSLLEIDPSNSIAITGLVSLIQNFQDENTFALIVAFAAGLEYNSGLGNSIFIEALGGVIQNTEYEESFILAAAILGKIDPGNSIAIQSLEQSIENCQDEHMLWLAAELLWQISPGNSTTIKALRNLSQSQDESIRRMAAESLSAIAPSNSRNIVANEALGELSQISQDEEISILVYELIRHRDKDASWEAVCKLEKILGRAQMPGVVTALKDYLSNETSENDFERYKHCDAIIWHCARTLPYPTFYQVWHNLQLTAPS